MNRFALVLLTVSLVALIGCPKKAGDGPGAGVVQEVTKDGLTVELRMPRRHLVRGEMLPITVTARNQTKEEMAIDADSGAAVYVTLWRQTSVGWEQVKRYPESVTMVATKGRLGPKASQSFPLNLRVAPDWPTGELLRITAELNGRPEPQAGAYIQVFATQEECDKAKVY
jgi:hypothetical protein